MPVFSSPSRPTVIDTGSDPLLGIHLSSANLPNWTAKRDAVLAGTGSARLVLLGDSTTGAAGADAIGTGTPTFLNAFHNGPASGVARMLTARGCRAVKDGFLSDQNANFGGGPGVEQCDLRVTRTAGWASPTGSGFCGGSFQATAAATITFTVFNPIDTIEVYYGTTTGGGTFDVNVDGGATIQTINCNAANGIAKATLSCALGLHTVNVVWASGTALFFGLICSDSTAKKVNVISAGHGAGTVVTFGNVSAYNYSSIASLLAADLTIINLGINDWHSNLSNTLFNSGLDSIVSLAQRGGLGDVMLVTPFPSSYADTVPTRQERILANIFAKARAGAGHQSAIPLLDYNTYMYSYASEGNSSNNSVTDALHPNGMGYMTMAQLYTRACLI